MSATIILSLFLSTAISLEDDERSILAFFRWQLRCCASIYSISICYASKLGNETITVFYLLLTEEIPRSWNYYQFLCNPGGHMFQVMA